MNMQQRHRLETAAKIIADHVQAIARLEQQWEWLKVSTDLSFWNTGNCEQTMKVNAKEQGKLFEQIRDAAMQFVRREIKQHQDRIDNFSAHYVERGD